MNYDQLEQVLAEARYRFLAQEGYLLEANVNERSLTHKFAEHLQALVGREWAVDCEYNRYGAGAKVIEDLITVVGPSTSTFETKARTVYPDIIVHRRGPAGPNLLVIEAKKDASQRDRKDDWLKLTMIRAESHTCSRRS